MQAVQDTLGRAQSVVDELDDGSRLVHDANTDRFEFWPGADAPTGEQTTTWSFSDRDAARVLVGLWRRTGGFSRPTDHDEYLVPISVVREGRKAVAAWVFVVWPEADAGDVAEELDYARKTVYDYLSDVRGWARDAGEQSG